MAEAKTEERWLSVDEQPRNLIDWIRQLLQAFRIRAMGKITQQQQEMMQKAMETVANTNDVLADVINGTASNQDKEYIQKMLGDTLQEQQETLAIAKKEFTEGITEIKNELGFGKPQELAVLRKDEKEVNKVFEALEKQECILNRAKDLIKNNSNAYQLNLNDNGTICMNGEEITDVKDSKDEKICVFVFPSQEQEENGTYDGEVLAVSLDETPMVIKDFASLDDFEQSEIFQKASERAGSLTIEPITSPEQLANAHSNAEKSIDKIIDKQKEFSKNERFGKMKEKDEYERDERF